MTGDLPRSHTDLPKGVLLASIADVSRHLVAGRVRATALAEGVLARAEELAGLRAFILLTPELLMAGARRADGAQAAGKRLGPLHGVPVSVKDLIDVRGLVTTGGSALHPDRVAARDAAVWSALDAAGACLVGKTNLHELAYGATSENPHYGTVRNPWDPDRIVGGSSGGSAVAVAAGLSYLSVGTDTGGSIRLPAAFTGICGLKPTRGLVATTGVLPLSRLHDHVGPMARSALDCAIALETMARDSRAGSRSTDFVAACGEWSGGLRGLRFGVLREHVVDATPSVQASFQGSLVILERLGARLADISIPEGEGMVEAARTLVRAEAAHRYAADLIVRAHLLGDDVREQLVRGASLSEHDVQAARHVRRRGRGSILRRSSPFDAIVGPTVRFTAPTLDEIAHPVTGPGLRAALLVNTYPFNVTGQPALSVPSAPGGGGLPVGLQIVALPGRDDIALAVGHAFQMRSEWHLHHPPTAQPTVRQSHTALASQALAVDKGTPTVGEGG